MSQIIMANTQQGGLHMKKILVCSFLFLTFAMPVMSAAADKIVTVEWTISSTSVADIQNYTLNYSPNSDMSGETAQTCEPWQQTGTTGDQTSFSMTCNNVPIVSGQLAYFTIEAVDTEGSISVSNIFSKDTKPSIVQNFLIITPGANILPTAVINFTQNGSTIIFDANGSSDSDGSIVEYLWDFGDGTTGTGTTPSHQFATGTFTITLAVTDDQGGESSTQTNVTISSTPFQIAVNFQPKDSEIPAGYVPDSNESFDQVNGYGWPVGLGTNSLYDQDSSLSPDQAYDTMTNSTITDAYWELALPESGSYHVTVCMGDPRNSYGTMKAQVEGVSIIDDQLSSTQRWIENSQNVNVTDGRLTLTFSGTDRVQVCWVKVEKN